MRISTLKVVSMRRVVSYALVHSHVSTNILSAFHPDAKRRVFVRSRTRDMWLRVDLCVFVRRCHSHTHTPLVLPVCTHIDLYVHVDMHHVDLYIHVNIHEYEWIWIHICCYSHKHTLVVLPVYTHIDLYIHVDIRHLDLYIHVNIHRHESINDPKHTPLVLPVYTHVDIYIRVDIHHVNLFMHVNIYWYESIYFATAIHTQTLGTPCVCILIYKQSM